MHCPINSRNIRWKSVCRNFFWNVASIYHFPSDNILKAYTLAQDLYLSVDCFPTITLSVSWSCKDNICVALDVVVVVGFTLCVSFSGWWDLPLTSEVHYRRFFLLYDCQRVCTTCDVSCVCVQRCWERNKIAIEKTTTTTTLFLHDLDGKGECFSWKVSGITWCFFDCFFFISWILVASSNIRLQYWIIEYYLSTRPKSKLWNEYRNRLIDKD